MMYVLKLINPEGTFKYQLLELLKTCPNGQLKEMGFPAKWQDEKFWQI
jgi:hypothetical protein